MSAVPPRQEGLSREAKYAIGTTIGCLGLICLVCAAFFVVASVPDAIGLPVSVAAAAVPAILYVLAVIWLDRYEHEPYSLLLGAFFWGAVVAVVLAVILELAGGLATAVLFGVELADVAIGVIGAPLAEETTKGLVLVILFFVLRNEFDDTLDGIVYGSVVGLGFAMTENIVYLGREYLRGGVTALAELFVIRIVLSGLAHALYTGSTGAGLGFARETSNLALKILVPAGAFTLAIVQHFMWNGTVQVLGALLPETQSFATLLLLVGLMSLVLSGPALLVLLTIVYMSWRRESRVISTYLAGEVEAGVMAPEDYATISSSWRRTRSLYGALFSRGLFYWYLLRKLYQTETELAFCKWRAARGEPPRRATEDRYRAQIEDIRARLGAM